MIYDGHSYAFPSQLGNAGWADRKLFMRHLQFAMAAHVQPAWRARDRAPADSSGLIDFSRGRSFDSLKDAQFRPAGHGRFEWTVDGEVYVKQVMPPSIIDHSYSAESLVAEMDYAGVDRSLIHRTPYLGIGNDFLADCVRRFPDRLQALAHVEEWLVQPETYASIAKVERAIKDLGLHGLHWLPSHLDLYGQTEPWDSEGFLPFWNAVASLDIPVWFTLNPTSDPPLVSYLEELRTLGRWMDRYPDVTVVLTHGFSWRMFAKADRIEVSEEVFAAVPTDNPNFHVQLLFAVLLGAKYDYPMPQMRSTLEDLVRRMGADRLIWGSDIPILLRHYTYRQCLDSIRLYCDFLSPREKDQILGGNMARIMNLDVS